MHGVRLLVALVQATTVVLASSSPSAGASGEVEWAGLGCGFASSGDFLGIIDDNGEVQRGELDCGPWIAADVLAEPDSTPPALDDSPTLAQITIHGWIQVNDNTPAHGSIPSAHCDFVGTGVAGGGCVISYRARATDNVYICTTVEMTHDGVTETYYEDDDDNAANGVQCRGGNDDWGAGAR